MTNYKIKKLDDKSFFVNGDILDGLTFHKNRKDNDDFDMIILDPPYYRKVDEAWDKQWQTKEEYYDWCRNWIDAVYSVSKKSCTVWLFGYVDELRTLSFLMEDVGFTFRQQIVIDKGLQSIAGRSSKNLKSFPTATEYCWMFYRDTKDEIRDYLQAGRKSLGWTGADVNRHLGKAVTGGGTFSTIASVKKAKEFRIYPTKDDWTKLQEVMNLPSFEELVYSFKVPKGCTDVWSDISFYNQKKIHPTQKPSSLIKRIIETANRPQRILDPFMGSGVTYKVAKSSEYDHTYLGIEKDELIFNKSLDYVKEQK